VSLSNKRWLRRIQVNVTAEQWRSSYAASRWRWVIAIADVRIGATPNFPFKPKVHLNYAETILRMKDGLPKLKDFPAEIGGSGETLPE